MITPNTGNTELHWSRLYKISGVTTIVMMVLFLIDTICWIAFGPYPSSAEGWFSLLQENRLIGLLLLNFPTLYGTILYYLTFLCLYNLLKPVNKAYAGLAALFAFVGLSIILVTHMGYPTVYLANQYAAAVTGSQRILFLAAGETSIATTVTGANIGGFLAEGALVIFSILMLRSKIFTRGTAYLGILGHGLDLMRIIMNLSFLPEGFGAILLMIGGLPQLVWLILVSRKFFQLSKTVTQT
jgi:hypothetical protein